MKHHVLAILILVGVGSMLSCTSAAAQALPKADEAPLPPMYTLHDYQVASKFAEGMMLAEPAKTAVIEYQVDEGGKWPASNDEAKFVPSLDAKYPVQSVSIGPGGTITVLFNCLVAELCRKSAVLSPILGANGKVQFTCNAPEIPLIYRRKACR